MDVLIKIFGEGKDLTALQMTARGVVIFIITLILIRISGRRSFGLKTPADNIIVILLGSLLSRAIAGVSPFVPVVAVSFTVVILHRLITWVGIKSPSFKHLVDGKRLLLFENGKFLKENMDKALLCEEDAMQGTRKAALTDDLNKIDRIYMECTGEISPLKKQP